VQNLNIKNLFQQKNKEMSLEVMQANIRQLKYLTPVILLSTSTGVLFQLFAANAFQPALCIFKLLQHPMQSLYDIQNESR